MRTTTELLDMIRTLQGAPQQEVQNRAAFLVQLLPWRHAKRFLRPERRRIGREGWEDVRIHPDDERVLFVLKERQRDAWTAANSKNANAVGIALAHFEMLLWFLGRDHEEAHHRLWDRFEHYGKPQLVWLAEEYELGDWRKWDDGRWQLMALHAALPAEDALAAWRKRGLKAMPPPDGGSE